MVTERSRCFHTFSCLPRSRPGHRQSAPCCSSPDVLIVPEFHSRSHLGTVTAGAARVCGEFQLSRQRRSRTSRVGRGPFRTLMSVVSSGLVCSQGSQLRSDVGEAHVENAGRRHVAYTVRAVGQIGCIIDGCPDVGIAIDCENVIDRTLTARGIVPEGTSRSAR
jgi:hypothetical protein